MSQGTEVRTFEKEAVPLIRSGLSMKKAALELSLQRYEERLRHFERIHGMDSATFADRFDRGELGDEADWFEWEYHLDAYHQARKHLEILGKIDL